MTWIKINHGLWGTLFQTQHSSWWKHGWSWMSQPSSLDLLGTTIFRRRFPAPIIFSGVATQKTIYANIWKPPNRKSAFVDVSTSGHARSHSCRKWSAVRCVAVLASCPISSVREVENRRNRSWTIPKATPGDSLGVTKPIVLTVNRWPFNIGYVMCV